MHAIVNMASIIYIIIDSLASSLSHASAGVYAPACSSSGQYYCNDNDNLLFSSTMSLTLLMITYTIEVHLWHKQLQIKIAMVICIIGHNIRAVIYTS